MLFIQNMEGNENEREKQQQNSWQGTALKS